MSVGLGLVYLAAVPGLVVRTDTSRQALQGSARPLALLAFVGIVVVPTLLPAIAHIVTLWRQRSIKQAWLVADRTSANAMNVSPYGVDGCGRAYDKARP